MPTKYGYVYKTTNLLNNKIYVGQHRANKFDESYYGSGKTLLKSIAKNGLTNFKVEILEWCYSKEQLNDREIYYIKLLDATNREIGYNITRGGNGGDTFHSLPIERQEQLRELHHTIKFSEEVLKRRGEKLKGRPRSQEVRDRISQATKGKPKSEETKLKLSQARMGIQAHNKGTVVINDGEHNKYIKKDELEQYLSKGYVRGAVTKGKPTNRVTRGNKGMRWYTNGSDTIICLPQDKPNGYKLKYLRKGEVE